MSSTIAERFTLKIRPQVRGFAPSLSVYRNDGPEHGQDYPVAYVETCGAGAVLNFYSPLFPPIPLDSVRNLAETLRRVFPPIDPA